MANQLADETKKLEAAGTPPSDAQLRAELEAERTARMTAEQQAGFYRGAASSEWQRAQQAEAARQRTPDQPLTDPFAKFAAEDPLLDPEKKAQLLDQGARSRAREEASKMGSELRARSEMDIQNLEARLALRMFQSAHPEMVNDQEGFAAAMTRAKIRADGKGMRLDPMGLLELGASVYNEGKAPSPTTPYTEAGAPGGPGGPMRKPDEPAPLSMAEKIYGAQDFIDEDKIPLDSYTEKFLDDRNMDLVGKEKFWSGIRNVRESIMGAKSRRSAGR